MAQNRQVGSDVRGNWKDTEPHQNGTVCERQRELTQVSLEKVHQEALSIILQGPI